MIVEKAREKVAGGSCLGRPFQQVDKPEGVERRRIVSGRRWKCRVLKVRRKYKRMMKKKRQRSSTLRWEL